ncbi:MAG: hypothetical protein EZS28_043875, partial [Streblomastix strix]
YRPLVVLLGSLVSYVGGLLELFADKQMRNFRKDANNRGKNMDTGLWGYSRHPNYLGEILFWWGVLIAGIGQMPWWGYCGAILVTALFEGISIGMMEKKLLAEKEGYKQYQDEVSRLIPLPRKKHHG